MNAFMHSETAGGVLLAVLLFAPWFYVAWSVHRRDEAAKKRRMPE